MPSVASHWTPKRIRKAKAMVDMAWIGAWEGPVPSFPQAFNWTPGQTFHVGEVARGRKAEKSHSTPLFFGYVGRFGVMDLWGWISESGQLHGREASKAAATCALVAAVQNHEG